MTVDSVRFVFVVACLLASYAQAEEAADAKALPLVEQSISQLCFGCICEASSLCDTTVGCTGSVCGPFSITWDYWSDSGKPTLNGEPSNSDGAFRRCTTDPFCAAKAVQGYMNKFARDCNGDGVINCDDYARIHRQGAYGCSAPLDILYDNGYRNCIRTFSK